MIEVTNISKTYHLGTVGVQALKEVCFAIGPGEYVAIIGHSGSGKSTLMHVLGLLDRPDSGSYRLCGREVTGLSDDDLAYLRNRLIGFVFQDFYLLSSLNALHNAELPLIYAGRGADRKKAKERIAEVGLAARALHRRRIAGHAVVAAQLPTQFGASLARLRALLAEHRPALVICLGLAASRGALSLERVAINVNDARIADNAGRQPVDEPVAASGPAAYFATVPIKAMVAAIREEGIPAEVSNSAGTFVCNHVFYGLQHALRTRRAARSGFMHLPLLPEQAQAGQATMPLTQMIDGTALALATALRWRAGDVRVTEGKFG